MYQLRASVHVTIPFFIHKTIDKEAYKKLETFKCEDGVDFETRQDIKLQLQKFIDTLVSAWDIENNIGNIGITLDDMGKEFMDVELKTCDISNDDEEIEIL